MGDAHFAFLLAPLLVIQLYNAQVFKLQLLIFAATAHLLLFLAVLLVVWVEVVLLVLSERVLLSHALKVEVTQSKH